MAAQTNAKPSSPRFQVETACLRQAFAPPRRLQVQTPAQAVEGWSCERQVRLAGRRT